MKNPKSIDFHRFSIDFPWKKPVAHRVDLHVVSPAGGELGEPAGRLARGRAAFVTQWSPLGPPWGNGDEQWLNYLIYIYIYINS